MNTPVQTYIKPRPKATTNPTRCFFGSCSLQTHRIGIMKRYTSLTLLRTLTAIIAVYISTHFAPATNRSQKACMGVHWKITYIQKETTCYQRPFPYYFSTFHPLVGMKFTCTNWTYSKNTPNHPSDHKRYTNPR